jgi:hypothetical protein
MHNENLYYIINFILNGFLHVTLLFSFLTILYYYIISPLTESTLRDLIGSSIDTIYDSNLSNVTISLSQLIGENLKDNIQLSSFFNENFDESNINDFLNMLSNTDMNQVVSYTNSIQDIIKVELIKYIYDNQYIINNYLEQNSTKDKLVNINNESVMFFAVVISISLLVISTIFFILFKTLLPNNINVSEIVLENVITFIFVGAIEYWFFTTYAFNFIPMPASLISSSTIDNIKNLLNKPYIYTNRTDIPPLIINSTPVILH